MAIQSLEYHVLDIKIDDETLEKKLNELGRDGWDISAVFEPDEDDYGTLIFKRACDGIEPYSGSDRPRRQRPARKPRDTHE